VDNSQSSKSVWCTLPLSASTITGGFWAARRQVNREASLPHGFLMLEKAGNFRNLRIAAGAESGEFTGFWFADSDVYKWQEAVAWELGNAPDADLQAMFDASIALVKAAQLPSGYLDSWFQFVKPDEKWKDIDHGHELYCAGHLIQAAVAAHRALDDDRLLDITLRLVDHIYDTFGPGKRDETCGHPEIETALVELFRTTHDPRHLELAELFIDRRGRNRMRGHAGYGPVYQQDHVPVREATEVAGHAVRQLYLTTGVTDLYMETGEQALLDAMHLLWADMTERKMYLTGGVGSRFDGESFGAPYELPSDTCYCETCAAIASLMWNWRMLLVTGDGRYADLFERTLYNGVLASPGLEGCSYLYVNPLQVRGGRYVRASSDVSSGAEASRPDWHNCACCPPNVMRLFSSLHHYLATNSAAGVQIHQFAPGVVQAKLADGAVVLEISTDYPCDGRIAVKVRDAPLTPWTLALRIPEWSEKYDVHLNSKRLSNRSTANGYLLVERTWHAGDEIALQLNVQPHWIEPNPRVDAIRGCVAIERGPLVYCFESHDQASDVNLLDAMAFAEEPPVDTALEIPGGGVAVQAEGLMVRSSRFDTLYRPLAYSRVPSVDEVVLTAIPYYAWGNRGIRSMRIWIPEAI
jgi:hypothetical protein